MLWRPANAAEHLIAPLCSSNTALAFALETDCIRAPTALKALFFSDGGCCSASWRFALGRPLTMIFASVSTVQTSARFSSHENSYHDIRECFHSADKVHILCDARISKPDSAALLLRFYPLDCFETEGWHCWSRAGRIDARGSAQSSTRPPGPGWCPSHQHGVYTAQH